MKPLVRRLHPCTRCAPNQRAWWRGRRLNLLLLGYEPDDGSPRIPLLLIAPANPKAGCGTESLCTRRANDGVIAFFPPPGR